LEFLQGDADNEEYDGDADDAGEKDSQKD